MNILTYVGIAKLTDHSAGHTWTIAPHGMAFGTLINLLLRSALVIIILVIILLVILCINCIPLSR